MDLHSANSLKRTFNDCAHAFKTLAASVDRVSMQTRYLSMGSEGTSLRRVEIWSEVAKMIERWACSMLNGYVRIRDTTTRNTDLHVSYRER
jgi:hypothetical protein